jgi:hypothetical protein
MHERALHPEVTIRTSTGQIGTSSARRSKVQPLRVMGQDAVIDAAALGWEAHVRAPIVEGEDASAIVDDENRAMATVHNEPPLELELLKAAR